MGAIEEFLRLITSSNAHAHVRARAHTNAIEYIQGNMYGLAELQKIVAEKIGIETGAYHHFSDSLFISKKHSPYLDKTLKR